MAYETRRHTPNHMNPLEKQFQNATRHVALTADEKLVMRERLVTYMEYAPVRATQVEVVRPSAFPLRAFFGAHHVLGGALIAVLVVSSTFGVSSAAADALPGDFLYSVKVDVNEEVYAAFLQSAEDRLAWERERAERRLEEASTLAAEGRLNDENKEEVSRRFAQHTTEIVDKVREVESEDPVLAAEVSDEFEAALDTHEAVLARFIVEQDEEAQGNARSLVEQVRSAAIAAGEVRDTAEGKLTASLDADASVALSTSTGSQATTGEEDKTESVNLRERAVYRSQERAERHLRELEALIARLDAQSDIAVQASAQVEVGKGHMSQASAALEAHDMRSAYGEYKNAATIFQKVAQLLQVAKLFDVEIYEPATEVDMVATVPSDALITSVTSVDESNVDEKRAQIDTLITEARSRLIADNTLDEVMVTRINNLLKDALANKMRGEIAIVLNDNGRAKEMFSHASRAAQRAIDLMPERDDAREGVNSAQTDRQNGSGTSSGVVMPDLDDLDLPVLDVVTVYHTYTNGVHTYSGAFYTPTACFTLTAEARVAESYPEQVTILLATTEGKGTCAMVIDRKDFTLEVKASEGAEFKGVVVNGVQNKWKLVQGTSTGETPLTDSEPLQNETPEAATTGTGTTLNSDSASSLNLFERAFERTNGLLRFE